MRHFNITIIIKRHAYGLGQGQLDGLIRRYAPDNDDRVGTVLFSRFFRTLSRIFSDFLR